MENFNDLSGRKFKIVYKDVYDYQCNRKHIDSTTQLKRIEGVLENFNPSGEVVISSDDKFTIILYCTIVQMEEIKK